MIETEIQHRPTGIIYCIIGKRMLKSCQYENGQLLQKWAYYSYGPIRVKIQINRKKTVFKGSLNFCSREI